MWIFCSKEILGFLRKGSIFQSESELQEQKGLVSGPLDLECCWGRERNRGEEWGGGRERERETENMRMNQEEREEEEERGMEKK